MRIILEVEDLENLKPYADEMIKAYISDSLRLFKITKTKIRRKI